MNSKDKAFSFLDFVYCTLLNHMVWDWPQKGSATNWRTERGADSLSREEQNFSTSLRLKYRTLYWRDGNKSITKRGQRISSSILSYDLQQWGTVLYQRPMMQRVHCSGHFWVSATKWQVYEHSTSATSNPSGAGKQVCRQGRVVMGHE